MRLPEFKAQPSPGGGAFPAVLKQVWPWVALVVVAGVIFLASLRETNKGDGPEGQTGVPPEAGPSVADPAEFKRGYELSKQVCQTCHLYPEPQLLDRFTWSFEVLPKMGFWMGYEKYDFDKEPGGQRVKEANIIPQAPILEFKDWRAICNYYVTAAPMKALPQAARPKIKIGLKHFQPIITTYPRKAANALVQINPGTRTLFVGNDDEHTLEVFGLDNKVTATVKFDSTPVSLLTVANGMLVTLIGSISPSDDPMGKLVLVSRPGVGPPQYREILTKLQRPTDTLVADLNKDGRDDLVICEYGNILGRCCWWENLGDHRYKEHELLDRCGSTKAQLYDINGDGLMDVFLMTAQAREGIYLFLNRGKGDFLMLPVVEQPPAWGNVYFELVDFNKDGFIDILAVNGDNGDNVTYPYVLKNYHGVRIYLNDGKNHFQEAYFYPLNGAYKAVARDFDNDGDLDIVAVSYFPDYEKSRAESCVYLENKGNLKFEASSFSESISGKWISMDAADLDGDGDIDVVLGAYEGGPGAVPQMLRNVWEKHGASILILKNTIIP